NKRQPFCNFRTWRRGNTGKPYLSRITKGLPSTKTRGPEFMNLPAQLANDKWRREMTLPGHRQATSASRTPLRLPSGWGCRELYLWQSDPAQKISEARIGAEVVEPRVNIDIDDYPFRKPLLQSSKCCILFVQHRVITGRKV